MNHLSLIFLTSDFPNHILSPYPCHCSAAHSCSLIGDRQVATDIGSVMLSREGAAWQGCHWYNRILATKRRRQLQRRCLEVLMAAAAYLCRGWRSGVLVVWTADASTKRCGAFRHYNYFPLGGSGLVSACRQGGTFFCSTHVTCGNSLNLDGDP